MPCEYTYCVVEDAESGKVGKDGLPISTGSVRILFDGGFDKEACDRWIAEHPDEFAASPTMRVMSFSEPE